MRDPRTRRDVLALGGTVLVGGLAGCLSDGDDDTENGDSSPAGGGTDTQYEEPRDGPGSQTASPAGPTATGHDGESETGPETETPSPPLEGLSVSAERLATGFTSPVSVAVPRSGERYVVDQAGQVYRHTDDGLHDSPVLDVTDRMVSVGGYTEKGLLGLAFHPDYATNGRVFVRYSAPPRDGTPVGYSHTFVLSEFRVDPASGTIDPDSERTVLEIPQPQRNHNAGAVAFGPDGYLYVGVGDGGAANDQGNGHVDDWYDAVAGGNGQDVTENLLGSVLRIDIDGAAGEKNYAVPDDNPLVGRDGRDEQFAWGFRNPWRFSFGPDGRLFVADVGQRAFEEVSVVENGGNYGWNVREGTHCFGADSCPDEGPDGRPLRDPVIEYPHGGQPVSGIAVIGGYLYDGEAISDLRGRYVFADWRAQGRLFVAAEDGGGLWPMATLSVDADEQFGPSVLSFGRTPDGELLVCTTAESGVEGSTGSLFRLRGV